MSKPGGVTAPRARRRWAMEQKRRIVEASLAAGASIAEVARAHDVNANQVHMWRRLYERGLLDSEGERNALLPVRVVPDTEAPMPGRSPTVHKVRGSRPRGVIHVEIGRGRLRIEGTADPVSLRMVLESLLGC